MSSVSVSVSSTYPFELRVKLAAFLAALSEMLNLGKFNMAKLIRKLAKLKPHVVHLDPRYMQHGLLQCGCSMFCYYKLIKDKKCLKSAITHDDGETVDAIVTGPEGLCPDTVSGNATSGLRIAARIGNVKMVIFLLSKGAVAQAGMEEAVSSGNLDIVLLLLERGAKVTTPTWLPQLAATGGHIEVLKLLLEKGATLKDGTHHLLQVVESFIHRMNDWLHLGYGYSKLEGLLTMMEYLSTYPEFKVSHVDLKLGEHDVYRHYL